MVKEAWCLSVTVATPKARYDPIFNQFEFARSGPLAFDQYPNVCRLSESLSLSRSFMTLNYQNAVYNLFFGCALISEIERQLNFPIGMNKVLLCQSFSISICSMGGFLKIGMYSPTYKNTYFVLYFGGRRRRRRMEEKVREPQNKTK